MIIEEFFITEKRIGNNRVLDTFLIKAHQDKDTRKIIYFRKVGHTIWERVSSEDVKKGKIITSLGYGVPCVATSIATEGMGLVAGHHILQEDSPAEFADAVVKIYTNPELWLNLSTNGLEAVKEKYSIDVVEKRLASMLKSLDINEP